MANADQILSLLRNHLNNDDAQFKKVALNSRAKEWSCSISKNHQEL